jgi:KR domain
MAAAGAVPLSTVSIFTSTSALLGPAGQANYAAANAALGAWADQQHAAGVAATSVMWGAWAAGMAAVEKVRQIVTGCEVSQEQKRTGCRHHAIVAAVFKLDPC